jgi:hypothetical protein
MVDLRQNKGCVYEKKFKPIQNRIGEIKEEAK